MSFWKLAPAALLAAGATVGAALYLGTGEVKGSSPEKTVYSFVHALRHTNYGRACSYLAESAGGQTQGCAEGMQALSFNSQLMGAGDPWVGLQVKPGSREQIRDDVVRFKVQSTVIPADWFYVQLGSNGKWRIVQLGGAKFTGPPAPSGAGIKG